MSRAFPNRPCGNYIRLHSVRPDARPPKLSSATPAVSAKPVWRLIRRSVRQDLAIGAFRRAGVFGAGGTVDELRRWLTDAGLTVDRLQRSGAVAHFTATAPR